MQASRAFIQGSVMIANVVIRTDSSLNIGTGHVMRCLALAESLRAGGASVCFICRELPGNLCNLIEAERFKVHRLLMSASVTPHANGGGLAHSWQLDAKQTNAILAGLLRPIDWLVVDHYGLDREWEQTVRPQGGRILVIDDLANRPHDCDLLLDQNLQEDPGGRYKSLVPMHCQTLFGPKYALLRSEFRRARTTLRRVHGTVQRILVFFGGTDSSNQTGKSLEAIRQLHHPKITVDVVVGRNNPHREELQRSYGSLRNVSLHYETENMAGLMARADLGIGAGGTTTWERCCLGLPSIVITVATNQEPPARTMGKNGALLYLGGDSGVTADSIAEAINIMRSPSQLRALSHASLSLVDGQGRARVTEQIMLTQAERVIGLS